MYIFACFGLKVHYSAQSSTSSLISPEIALLDLKTKLESMYWKRKIQFLFAKIKLQKNHTSESLVNITLNNMKALIWAHPTLVQTL